jgi:hypothetical protein
LSRVTAPLPSSPLPWASSPKVRHLLKLSPEKWDEVSAHAAGAVVPDFRPRVWWCPSVRGGLLFACRNGAIVMDQPIAFVSRGSAEADDSVMLLHQLDPVTFNLLPKLRQQALQEWFAPGHSGWAVYWRDASDPLAQQMAPPPAGAPAPALPLAALGTPPADMVMPRGALGLGGTPTAAAPAQQPFGGPPPSGGGGGGFGGPGGLSGGGAGVAPGGAVFALPPGGMDMGAGMAVDAIMGGVGAGGGGGLAAAQMALHQQHAAMAAAGMSPTALQMAQQQQQQQQSGGGMVSPTMAGMKGPSPFASQGTQSSVPTDAFPAWAASQGQPGTPGSARPGGGGGGGGGPPRGPSANGAPPPGPSGGGGGAPPGAPGPSSGGAGGGGTGGGGPPGGPPPLGGVDSKLNAMLPSLEMINTDDLPPIGANPSLFSLDSLQQIPMLNDLPSVGVGQLLGGGGSSLEAMRAAGPGAGAPRGSGDGSAGGGGPGADRSLSLKFSMSLDLAEAAGKGSGSGS